LKKIYFLLLTVFTLQSSLHAQEKSGLLEHVKFAKEKISLDVNQLYFNVLQFHNKSKDTLFFQPKIVSPKGWRSMTFLPKKIILAPNQKKYIPLRIRPSRDLAADKKYQVKVNIKELKLNQEFALINPVGIKTNHNWNISCDESNYYFSGDELFVDVNFQISNEGNTREKIELSYSYSKQIFIDKKNAKDKIVLEAGMDTIITKRVFCQQLFKNLNFNNAILRINGISGEETKHAEISFVKLQSTYDRFDENSTIPDNIAGISMKSSGESGETQMGAFVKGKVRASENADINYEVSSTKLNGSEDFWRDNYIALNYESENLSFGLGSSFSEMGADLYKRNSVFAQAILNVNAKNRIVGFANTSITDKNSGAAIGHEFSNDKLYSLNSISYNANDSEKIYTRSARSNTRLSLNKSFLDYQGELVESTDKLSNDKTSLYDHRLRYLLEIGDKTEIQVLNDLNTTDKLNESRFSSFSQLRATYHLNDYGMSLTGAYTRKDIRANDEDDVDHSETGNNYSLQMSFPKILSTRFSFGASVDDFDSKFGENVFANSNTYNLFMNANYRKKNISFLGSARYGLQSRSDEIESDQRSNKIDFDGRLTHMYSNVGQYKLGLRYSGTSGDKPKYAEEDKLIASAGIHHSFLGRKLNVSVDGNYDVLANKNNQNFSLNFELETQIKRNLSFSLRGNFRPKQSKRKMALSTVEAALVMGFDSGEKIETHGVEVMFFKDVNANGKLDKGEQLIESILANLRLTEDENGSYNDFIASSLMSDAKGKVKWKHLNRGSYQLNFQSLKSLSGYFNFSGNQMDFFLNRDKKFTIPYVMAAKIYGSLTLKKSNFSSVGMVDLTNIRVTAIDSTGKEYSALTDKMGSYTIYVPKNKKYKLVVKNVFGGKMSLNKNNIPVSMIDLDKFMVNFVVQEKKRRINFKRK
jgi:hypothetical protein